MIGWMALSALAWAEPTVTSFGDKEFVSEGSLGRIWVREVQMPEGAAEEADARICRVRFTGTEEGRMAATVVEDRCPAELVEPTEVAMAGWDVQLQPAEDAGTVPFEVWVRYGLGAREVPELFVRGDHRQQTQLPQQVALVALAKDAVPPPSFPDSAREEGILAAECTVDIEVSHRGYLLGEAVVSGCAEPFATAAREAGKRWHFQNPKVGREPSASASTVGVTFELVPGSEPGELTPVTRVVLAGVQEKKMLLQAPPKRSSGIPKNAEPLLVVDSDPYAEVKVFDWGWPEVTVDAATRCDILVQVDSRRRVVVWPESCPDTTVRDATVAAVKDWALQPGRIDPGERYGRFRFAMVLSPDAAPHVVLPEKDLVSVADEVADRVRTFAEPVTRSRVPPKRPRGLDGSEDCTVRVQVSKSGKPADIRPVECSDAAFDEARKAVKQWRWDPARENGEAREWETTVKLTFAG